MCVFLSVFIYVSARLYDHLTMCVCIIVHIWLCACLLTHDILLFLCAFTQINTLSFLYYLVYLLFWVALSVCRCLYFSLLLRIFDNVRLCLYQYNIRTLIVTVWSLSYWAVIEQNMKVCINQKTYFRYQTKTYWKKPLPLKQRKWRLNNVNLFQGYRTHPPPLC